MTVPDNYQYDFQNMSNPVSDAFVVSPHDSNGLRETVRAIYVGTQGDLRVEMAGGGDVVFTAAIGFLPIRVSKVFSTNTTATNILGLV